MKQTLRAALGQPIYPWLVGIFPILHLYLVNYGLIIDREVPITMFWVLAATTFFFFALCAAKRNRSLAAIITAAVSLCFSLSGHVHSLITERESLLVWTLTVLILVAILVTELLKTSKYIRFDQLALPLNLIASAMILIQAIALVELNSNTFAGQLQRSKDDGSIAANVTTAKIQDSSAMPDIYFIVPDGYPSDTWLKSAMDFDNSAFTQALEDRGFVVVGNAQSNYASTLPSLASILNMRHFNANPTDLSDYDYLRLLISDSAVARYLLQLGYTYIHLLSGHLFPSPIADINRDFASGGTVDVTVESGDLTVALWDTARDAGAHTDLRLFHQRSFFALYLDTTWLKFFANRWPDLFLADNGGPYDLFSPHRFLDTIDEISEIVALPEATFTFVHLMKPHQPAVFDANGNIIDKIGNPARNEHLAELEFVNRKYISMIDEILAGSRHQPVIIFQADHGTTDGVVRGIDDRFIHFDVYAAYFIPDRYALDIPQPYTTINTFPLILNAVFDTGLEYSENRLFQVSREESKKLQHSDATDSFANWLN